MNAADEEIDSLNVFNQYEADDVFLDSLEPSIFKEKRELSVSLHFIIQIYICRLCLHGSFMRR